jgi:hypothetical protein
VVSALSGERPRAQLLRAAVGFAGCSLPSYDRALHALRTWLDSWAGIGHPGELLEREMSDAWLDLLRLCVMGAVGLGGAWLGAQATRRRERWSHRREVYQPILLSLMDLDIHSRHRLRLEEESDSADPKSQVRLNETIERAAAAMTEVQRVSAIALVLGDDVRAALDELGTEWLNATHQNTGRGEADARYAAVQKARRIVEATAKRHLRL